MKKQITKLVAVVIMFMLCVLSVNAQQIIGSFSTMNGGFEGQTTGALTVVSSVSSAQTLWTTQSSSSASATLYATGGRSGPQYAKVAQTGGTARRSLQSPTVTSSPTGSYVIQFYYRGDLDGTIPATTDNIRGGIGSNGSGTSAYGTYVQSPNTGAINWAKYTSVVSTTGTSFFLGYVGLSSSPGLFDIDDYVIYSGSSVDTSAPSNPTSPSAAIASTTSLTVSWTGAQYAGDGGGYVIVRYSTNAAQTLNQNGIYAVTNTSATGSGTIVAITAGVSGTSQSFTNTGLTTGTPYYYTIFAVDKAFNYSAGVTCNGTPGTLGTAPTITSQGVTSIASTTATGNGNISDIGSSNITASGVCWSTTSGAETASGSHTIDGPTGTTTGAFTSAISGLTPGQTYYVKAYATNSEQTGYGTEVSFTTLGSVITASVTSLLQTTATCGGTIACVGSYDQKGVCWSTNSNPTITDSHTSDGSGSGNGSYSSSITGLTANSGYHVRAYITNGAITSYGADVPFTTLAEVPTIAVSKANLTDFGSVTVNQPSSTQTYMVSGSFLTSSVTITPPTGFQISNDGGSNWVSNPNTIVLTQTAGSLDAQPVTITTRFNPNAVSSFSANITHSATDATSQNVAVSGTGIAVTNPTALTVSKKSDNIVYLTWTAPSGSYDKVLVFAQAATDVTVSPSGAGSAYTGANLAWGTAATYGSGSDKLVYSGTGTSAEITGLTNGQTYYFKVYSYSGDSYGATPASANFITAVQPTTSLAGTSANTQSVLTWINPTYNVTQGNYWDEVIVLAKSGGAVDATPSGDGTAYSASATFGSGTEIGTANFVVYKGTGTTQTVTGLTNNTAYHYATFVRHGSEWSASNTANATPNAYISGDYRARASGNWGLNASPNTWEKYNGTTWSNCNTTDIPNSTTVNVFIPAGISVNVETSNRSVNNITVEGTLTSSGSYSSLYYINIYGNLTVNTGGYIGSRTYPTGEPAFNQAGYDGISFKFYGATSTINGTGGSIYFGRLVAQLANQTITINHDMTGNYHGSTNQGGHTVSVYPAVDNTTITIAAGKTLTMAPWACIATTTSSNQLPTFNFTVNVNGTLDVQDSPAPNTQTPSTMRSFIYGGTGTAKAFSLNIGSTGTVNAPQIYPNGIPASGIPTGTTSTVSIASGGVLNISQALDLRQVNQTISGSGTLNILSGATLRIGNTAGINGQILSTSPSLSTTANYQFEGTSTQVTGDLLPASVNNLVLNNSAGLTLSGSTTVNGALTVTAGNLTTGANTLTINGTTSGAGYIDNTAGTVTYGGASSQTVSNILNSTFNNLIIDNASGVNFTANYTSSNLTINSSKVLNVAAGKQLTVSTTMTNNGTLNLLSDASGTATILTPASISGTTGTVNVNQYLGTARNWYISSPISNAKAPAGYTYYQRDEAGASWTSQPFVATNTFVAGKGYIAMPGSTGATITFTTETGGTLNTGNVPVDLTYTSTAPSKGFNLIGNPYPSHLTWTKAFTDANASLIEPSIYLRTNAGSTNSSGQWSFPTYSALSGENLNGGSAIIPPMQAFWVRAVVAGTLTLNSNLTRSHQASNPLKAPAAKNIDRQRLRLEISNGISKDETLVFFDAAASDALDAYDTPKMSNNNVAIPEIYTLAGGEQLGINGLTAVTPNKELALGFNTGASNTFTLKATQVSNFDAETKIYLRDNLLNTEQELTVGASYTFSSDVTNTTTRFSLIFKTSAVVNGIQNNPYDYQNIAINTNGNNQITIYHANGERGTVTVCNAIGQKLISTQITGTSTIIGKQFSSGVYLVTVGNEANKVTKKVIIK